MPVSACITLLTKIQSDLRYTESEVVGYLKNQVDASDFRVNKIEAAVIPVSSYVTRGGSYQARIILAAYDSTQRPKITLNGEVLENSNYEVNCPKVGTFDITGKIELPRANGSVESYDFNTSYIVGEPTAIISADMMNVFYAGIEKDEGVAELLKISRDYKKEELRSLRKQRDDLLFKVGQYAQLLQKHNLL
jgi:gliding motility-associated protein GldM